MQQSHAAIVSLCSRTNEKGELSVFKHVVCFYVTTLYGQTWTWDCQATLFHVTEGLFSILTSLEILCYEDAAKLFLLSRAVELIESRR